MKNALWTLAGMATGALIAGAIIGTMKVGGIGALLLLAGAAGGVSVCSCLHSIREEKRK